MKTRESKMSRTQLTMRGKFTALYARIRKEDVSDQSSKLPPQEPCRRAKETHRKQEEGDPKGQRSVK